MVKAQFALRCIHMVFVKWNIGDNCAKVAFDDIQPYSHDYVQLCQSIIAYPRRNKVHIVSLLSRLSFLISEGPH